MVRCVHNFGYIDIVIDNLNGLYRIGLIIQQTKIN